MKKVLIAIFTIALAVVCTEAQVPNTFNYQAIARDIDGNTMVNHEIALQISLLQGRNGPVVFNESHRIETNDFGLINVAIGRGEVRVGELSAIDWSSGNYYMEVRMDAKGNGVFELLGKSELFSVPYALYAENAGGDSRQADFDWFVTGNDVCTGHGGSYPSGNVGIGTTTPSQTLHVYKSAGAANLLIEGTRSTTNGGIGNMFVKNSDDGALFGFFFKRESSNTIAVLSAFDGSSWYEFNRFNYSTQDLVYTSGVNNVTFSVGGDLLLNNTGNVGINNAAPSYDLDVTGNVNATSYYKGGLLFKEGQWTVSGSDIYYATNVGIGVSSPAHRLHISINSVTTNPQLKINNSYATGGDASFTMSNVSENYTIGIDANDNNNFEVANQSILTGVNTYKDGVTRFRIHNTSGSEGIVDKPYESRGRAYLGGIQYFTSPGSYPPTPPGWMPIDFDVASYDQHSEWTFLDAAGPPISYFTATEEGYYQINARTEFDLQEFEGEEYAFPSGTYVSIAIFVNQTIYAQGNNLQITQIAYPYGAGEFVTFVLPFNNAPNVSDVVYLSAGDVVEICVTVSNPHIGGLPVLILAGPYVTYASIHKVS